MPRIAFTGPSLRDDEHPQGNTSRLVNCYREPMAGMAQHVIKAVPGVEAFTTMGGDTPTLFVRDIKEIGGRMYVMAGGTLYSVLANGTQTALGDTVSKAGARIFGLEQSRIATVTDGRYFVWDGTEMLEPTGGNFTSFGSGVFLGNYVVLSQKNGRQFLWSDLADATTLPGLNFASAESTDGDIQRLIALNGRLWVMKEDVIEMWVRSGAAGANAFQAIPGGVIPTGLKAPDLVAEFDGGMMFVASDGIAYVSLGGQLQPISTPAVNTSIAQSTPTHCFAYEDQGHKFAVIRFSDRPAWVYDIVTNEWHERATGRDNPWDMTVAGRAYGSWYCAGVLGEVFRMTRNNRDADLPLIRTAVSNTVYLDGNRFSGRRLELTGKTGEGETGATQEVWTVHYEDGRTFDDSFDPLVMPDSAIWRRKIVPVREPSLQIRFSDDGGKTYRTQVVRDMGSEGEYGQRAIVRNFGAFRKLTVEASISGPSDVFLDCAMNLEIA